MKRPKPLNGRYKQLIAAANAPVATATIAVTEPPDTFEATNKPEVMPAEEKSSWLKKLTA
jgi:hypothetical protein